jgi:hypothetical protein
MPFAHRISLLAAVVALEACGGGSSSNSVDSNAPTGSTGSSRASGSGSGMAAGPSTGSSTGSSGIAAGPSSGATGGAGSGTIRDAGHDGGQTADGAASDAAGNDAPSGGDSGAPAGWLHTTTHQINRADGSVWVGRGVNIDDLLFCGYNYNFQTLGSSAEADVKTVIDEAVGQWHSNFLRISLYMDSYGSVIDWASDTNGYASAMTRIVKYVGAQYPGTYVLLSLRSDASMDCPSEPACVPTASTVPVYKALVDSFANDSFVLFGLSNEPAPATTADLIAAMNLGVVAIRAEETKLGVPQHLIAVQSMGSTGSFTATSIQPSGNILYEVHYYPGLGGGGPDYYSAYASTFPMLLGEYGDFGSSGDTSSASFFKDMETLQISSLAWDFDPLNDCAPDLLDINTGNAVSPVTASPWGQVVQPYLANPSSFK